MKLIDNGHTIQYVTHPDPKSTWVYVKVDGAIEANCKTLEVAKCLFERYDNGIRDHHHPLPEFATN